MNLLSHILLQLLFGFGLLMAGALFFQNTHLVDVHLGLITLKSVPLWLCMLSCFVLGLLVALGLCLNLKTIKGRK
ncbi:MAG: lipopolysaccharide assembly protein LapA domain-containing protein [Pseudomonadota bacterium]|nr:lipopolysaccharide assembly protein LapA domain-containing protein [Pseudomonadota bacterium]